MARRRGLDAAVNADRFRGNPLDKRHGTVNGYANLNCRCGRCRRGWARYVEERRRVRRAEDATEHGTVSTYTNYLCRCEACRAAKHQQYIDRVHQPG